MTSWSKGLTKYNHAGLMKIAILAAQRTNPMQGRHHSEESKAKISLGNKGKSRSEECKKRLSSAHSGKPWTQKRREAQDRKKGLGNLERKPYTRYGKEYANNWYELRKEIYERDDWTCQECNIKCHGNGTKDKIQCHHIDYNEKSNDPNNLITLCSSCHAKTNFRRADWTTYFLKGRSTLKEEGEI